MCGRARRSKQRTWNKNVLPMMLYHFSQAGKFSSVCFSSHAHPGAHTSAQRANHRSAQRQPAGRRSTGKVRHIGKNDGIVSVGNRRHSPHPEDSAADRSLASTPEAPPLQPCAAAPRSSAHAKRANGRGSALAVGSRCSTACLP